MKLIGLGINIRLFRSLVMRFTLSLFNLTNRILIRLRLRQLRNFTMIRLREKLRCLFGLLKKLKDHKWIACKVRFLLDWPVLLGIFLDRLTMVLRRLTSLWYRWMVQDVDVLLLTAVPTLSPVPRVTRPMPWLTWCSRHLTLSSVRMAGELRLLLLMHRSFLNSPIVLTTARDIARPCPSVVVWTTVVLLLPITRRIRTECRVLLFPSSSPCTTSLFFLLVPGIWAAVFVLMGVGGVVPGLRIRIAQSVHS